MPLIVQKFGGISVASPEVLQKSARHVACAHEKGFQVVVVVSAMAGVTNQLIHYVNETSIVPDPREYDVVVSAGEQITCGLMALALQNLGLKAQSWLAWQIPILSHETFMKSKIKEIRQEKLRTYLQEGGIPVVAGFQGISPANHLTTLGRGGSDLTAVALAAALQADRCDLYKDVPGIFTADPKIVSKAQKLEMISYEEMLELASQGSKVLQSQAVEMAIYHRVPLKIVSTFEEGSGTRVEDLRGHMYQPSVKGVVCNLHETKITLKGLKNPIQASAVTFGILAQAQIQVDMIVHEGRVETEEQTGKNPDSLTFTIQKGDAPQTVALLKQQQSDIDCEEIVTQDRLAKVSVVGLGLRSDPTLTHKLFKVLADRRVPIYGIATSEIKLTLLIQEEYVEWVTRALHTEFGLDQDEEDKRSPNHDRATAS